MKVWEFLQDSTAKPIFFPLNNLSRPSCCHNHQLWPSFPLVVIQSLLPLSCRYTFAILCLWTRWPRCCVFDLQVVDLLVAQTASREMFLLSREHLCKATLSSQSHSTRCGSSSGMFFEMLHAHSRLLLNTDRAGLSRTDEGEGKDVTNLKLFFLNLPLEQKKNKDKDGRWCGWLMMDLLSFRLLSNFSHSNGLESQCQKAH